MGSYRNHPVRDLYGGDRSGGWATSLRNGDRRRDARGRRSRSPRRHVGGRSPYGGRRRSDSRSRSRSRRHRKSSRDWRKRHRNCQDRRQGHGRRGSSYGRGGSNGRRRRKEPSPESSDEEDDENNSSDSKSPANGGGDGKKNCGKSGDSNKDEIIHFAWRRGDMLNKSRYRIVKLLGDGTFGRVLLSDDQQDNRQVAIKVIRDVKRYGENARIEADILKDIRRVDPLGEASRSAVMCDTFDHGRHVCLVFEPCGASLYDFLKKNSFRGFWMQDVQSFAEQSLKALAFLHEKLKMTHTDLKPENILLESMESPRQAEFPREATRKPSKSRGPSSAYVRPASAGIRLIDFGNATYEEEHHSSIINTRQYRGPEVILGLGWKERSDVWSMGCILMELYTGELLFGTHENLEHLALMERVLEPLPTSMISAIPKNNRDKYAIAGSRPRLKWPEGASSPSSERYVRSQQTLAHMSTYEHHAAFTDFVGHLLTMDPARRPSAGEALSHPFFSTRFSD